MPSVPGLAFTVFKQTSSFLRQLVLTRIGGEVVLRLHMLYESGLEAAFRALQTPIWVLYADRSFIHLRLSANVVSGEINMLPRTSFSTATGREGDNNLRVSHLSEIIVHVTSTAMQGWSAFIQWLHSVWDRIYRSTIEPLGHAYFAIPHIIRDPILLSLSVGIISISLASSFLAAMSFSG